VHKGRPQLPTAEEDKKLTGWQDDLHDAPTPAHESPAFQGSPLAQRAPTALVAPWNFRPCSFLERFLAPLAATMLTFGVRRESQAPSSGRYPKLLTDDDEGHDKMDHLAMADMKAEPPPQ
jgi:hypothetical protein